MRSTGTINAKVTVRPKKARAVCDGILIEEDQDDQS